MGRRNQDELLRIRAEAQLADLRKASGELDSLSDAVGGLDDAGQSASSGADAAGNAIGALVGIATGAGAAVIALGTALQGLDVVAGVVTGILDLNSATNLLEAQTGLTGDALQELVIIGDDIFENNWGDSLDDVHDAMQRVRNITGEEGDELEALTTHALAVRDIFDADISESVRGADTLMEQFGLSGTQAFDLITAGFQRTGDPADDLLDTFNEYSGNFSQMGFDAQEFLAILDAGLEGGARNTDDLADAVREFGIRLQDGTSEAQLMAIGVGDIVDAFQRGDATGEDVFRATIAALEQMEDPIDRNAAGVEIFGTRWEDMGEASVLAMDDMLNSMDNVDGAMQRAEDSVSRGLGPAIEGLKRTMGIEFSRALEPTVIELTEELTPAIQDLAEWIRTDGGPAVVEFAAWARDDAAPAIRDFADAVDGPLLTSLNLLGDAMDIIISNGEGFIEIVNAIGDAAGFVGGIAGDVGGFVGLGGGSNQEQPFESGVAQFAQLINTQSMSTQLQNGESGMPVSLNEEAAQELAARLDEIVSEPREMEADFSWVDAFDTELNRATRNRSISIALHTYLEDGGAQSATETVNADLGSMNLPGRALGGPVMAGRGYLVGENGPEPFFPGVSGTILPNSAMGGGPVVLKVQLNSRTIAEETYHDLNDISRNQG